MSMMILADAWWTGETAGWIGAIGGSLLGIAGALIGGLGSLFVYRGKGKRTVLGLMCFLVAACIGVFTLGIVALVLGQPYAVWYPCLLLGLVGTIVPGCLIPLILARSET
jgi:hypothetical protein